ncbi:glycoside hydrolase family 13 protein [Euzebya tangerina]|uniref:glycoside hydrolase family 13 protein n=1 Tax=Euzebya tangerina TaxID=591198 RepID=UPI000E313558|nr:glycoside hydrolase family 13 protein [Euzebya tangerina]
MTDSTWWRHSVTYQIYIRSFADGNGDGLGDIAGIRSRLPYLEELGVDAIWINPWYPSPMADGGYDVADYRAVEPTFGTMAEAEAMIAEAHEHDIRVMLDVVPNHSSDEHRWFVEAVAAEPGSPERDRYFFREGTGPDGAEPPNNWLSFFGGPAWTRLEDGWWYLHLFDAKQPDLNWSNPEVWAEFDDMFRFWFDRDVDGFRIDVAHSLMKDWDLPDVDDPVAAPDPDSHDDHPYLDRDQVHDVYRRWRKLADSYDPPRVFVAEAWVPDPVRLADYVRSDELHTTFNFPFLESRWTAADMRTAIDRTTAALRDVGAPATWVLSNHDVARTVSRYAREQADVDGHNLDSILGKPADFAVGVRRARAAALLMLGLPGAVYLYQGEELGLPEVEDLPTELLADPTWERSGRELRGRDGCRVPLPWADETPSLGFGPRDGAAPWLPQPEAWGPLSAAEQAEDPDSMLSLYRDALRIRGTDERFSGDSMSWLPADEQVLLFSRTDTLACLVNFGPEPVDVPDDWSVLLSSSPVVDDVVPADTAVWLGR